MKNTLDKCPHCKADTDEFLRVHLSVQPHYKCGVWEATPTHRTNLCKEREARQKAEVELAASQELVRQYRECFDPLLRAYLFAVELLPEPDKTQFKLTDFRNELKTSITSA